MWGCTVAWGRPEGMRQGKEREMRWSRGVGAREGWLEGSKGELRGWEDAWKNLKTLEPLYSSPSFLFNWKLNKDVCLALSILSGVLSFYWFFIVRIRLLGQSSLPPCRWKTHKELKVSVCTLYVPLDVSVMFTACVLLLQVSSSAETNAVRSRKA